MLLYEMLHCPAGPIVAPLLIILSLIVIFISIKSLFTPSKPTNRSAVQHRTQTQSAPHRAAPLPPSVAKSGPAAHIPPRSPQLPASSRGSIYDFPKCPVCRVRNSRTSDQAVFSTPTGFRCRSGHEF